MQLVMRARSDSKFFLTSTGTILHQICLTNEGDGRRRGQLEAMPLPFSGLYGTSRTSVDGVSSKA